MSFVSMNCSKEKMYFLIESLRRAGMNATEIHNITAASWPEECYSISHIRKICQEYNEERRTSFERKEGSGKVKSDVRLQNVDGVSNLIHQDNRISLRHISNVLGLSLAMVQRIVSDDLKRTWVRAKWVPHTLTEFNKAIRVERCRDLLDALGGRLARKNLVTIDEKMFYCRNMKPSNVTGCWMNAAGDEPLSQVARRTNMEKKFHAIVAVSQQGHHFFRVLPQNVTLNSERYVEFLMDLEAFLQGLPNPILSENLRLIQDNARPHVAANTIAHIEDRNIRLLRQPPYSPDCNLCDRYIFPRLESVRVGDFESRNELEQFLTVELDRFTQQRMQKALGDLLEDLQKIIDVNGVYL